MADDSEVADLEDLLLLERFERRERYVPEIRNNDLDELDNVDFRKRYRFDKCTIEAVVRNLSDKLHSCTARNNALSPTEKVLTAVKFFAFGEKQINIGDLHQVSQPSASRAINDVAKCLAELGAEYIYLPRSEAERMEISQEFYCQFGFPSVYGALDCTLIKILSPGGPLAETYRSRKNFFALNIQTLSDINLMIRNIVVRWPGSTHDSTIFDNSYLRAHLEIDVPRRYHVLGDAGYPLREYLLTPFSNPITDSQKRYNASHISARNVVERQYGVWKRRFASIEIPLRCQLKNVQTIIVATAVLHNLAISMGDYFDEENVHVEDEDEINSTESLGGIAKRNSVVANYF